MKSDVFETSTFKSTNTSLWSVISEINSLPPTSVSKSNTLSEQSYENFPIGTGACFIFMSAILFSSEGNHILSNCFGLSIEVLV